MANELNVTATLAYNKNSAQLTAQQQLPVNVAGNKFLRELESVATSDQALSLSGLGSIGWVLIRNLDTVNFVKIGPVSGTYPIKLAPGGFFFGQWNAAAIHALADTAACVLDKTIFEI